jgi:hypothetical protein
MGLSTLVHDTVFDDPAFSPGNPRGAFWVSEAASNEHLVAKSAADKFWKPRHIIGVPVMYITRSRYTSALVYVLPVLPMMCPQPENTDERHGMGNGPVLSE